MSKIKLKFILTSVFIGIFIFNVSVFAMQESDYDFNGTTQTTTIKRSSNDEGNNIYNEDYTIEATDINAGEDIPSVKFRFFYNADARELFKNYIEEMKQNLIEKYKNQKDLVTNVVEKTPCFIPDDNEKIIDNRYYPKNVIKCADYNQSIHYGLKEFFDFFKASGQFLYMISKKHPKYGEDLKKIKESIIKESCGIINFSDFDNLENTPQGVEESVVEEIKDNFNEETFSNFVRAVQKAMEYHKKYIEEEFLDYLQRCDEKGIKKAVDKVKQETNIDEDISYRKAYYMGLQKYVKDIEKHLGPLVLRMYYCIQEIKKYVNDVISYYKIEEKNII